MSEVFKKKLMHHLKEDWKQNQTPTKEDLKRELNLSSDVEMSHLNNTLCDLYTGNYLDCFYNDKERTCYTKKSSLLVWLILGAIIAPWVGLLMLIIFYPNMASMTLWRLIVLFENVFLLVLLLLKKKNNKNKENMFYQMHPELPNPYVPVGVTQSNTIITQGAVFCEKCGAKRRFGANFCTKCGIGLEQ